MPMTARRAPGACGQLKTLYSTLWSRVISMSISSTSSTVIRRRPPPPLPPNRSTSACCDRISPSRCPGPAHGVETADKDVAP